MARPAVRRRRRCRRPPSARRTWPTSPCRPTTTGGHVRDRRLPPVDRRSGSSTATPALHLRCHEPVRHPRAGRLPRHGYAQPAVFRPSTAQWFIDGQAQPVSFGAPNLTDIPVPGDYDGVGHAELAVFRPSTGQWFIAGHAAADHPSARTNLTDIPVPGDYDGVGHAELAVFRPSTGQWFIAGHRSRSPSGRRTCSTSRWNAPIGSLSKLGLVGNPVARRPIRGPGPDLGLDRHRVVGHASCVRPRRRRTRCPRSVRPPRAQEDPSGKAGVDRVGSANSSRTRPEPCGRELDHRASTGASLAMLRNVLILSASAGAGHVRAAQAIERAITETGAAQAVQHVDTLEYTNPLFRRLYSKAYIDMVNRMPEVLGWLYDYLRQPGEGRPPPTGVRQAQHPPVRQAPRAVSARGHRLHPLPAGRDHLVAHRQGDAEDPAGDRRHRLRHPRAVALPATTSITSSPSTRPAPPRGAGGPGRTRSRSRASPSTRPSPRPKDRAAMRAKYGLRRDGVVILISAGGFGVGKIDALITPAPEAPPPRADRRHLRPQRGAEGRARRTWRRACRAIARSRSRSSATRPRWTSTWPPPTSSSASRAA